MVDRKNLPIIRGHIPMRQGSDEAVSESDEGRVRYNEVDQRFEVSVNGGPWDPIATFGSSEWDYFLVTADATIADPVASPVFVEADTTSGAITLTLPDVSTIRIFPTSVEKSEGSPAGNKVTVAAATLSQTINGMSAVDIIVPGDVLRFFPTGSSWRLM